MLRSTLSLIGETIAPSTKVKQFLEAAKNGGYLYVDHYIKKYPTCEYLNIGLALAAQFEHAKTVETFLKHGICDDEALIKAIEKNNLKIVELLLNAGANRNLSTRVFPGTGNALALACRDENIKIEIIEILMAGTDLTNSNVNYTISPLIQAVMSGREDVVYMLLKNGANIEYLNFDGKTALDIAIEKNRISCLELLLDAGANYKQRAGQLYPPIIAAARNNNFNIMEMLIKKGAKIPCDDQGKPSHLDYSYHRHIKELLVSTAATQISDEADFLTAIKNQKFDIIKFWISNKIDVNYHDKHNMSAIHYASYYACKHKSLNFDQSIPLEIIHLLLDAGASVDQYNTEGRNTLLHVLQHLMPEEENDAIEVIKLLVNATQNINLMDKNTEETALHVAASKGFVEITKILLAAKANTEARDAYNKYHNPYERRIKYTPLHRAIKGNHTEIVNLLLGHGADANSIIGNGITPLMLAADHGRVDMMKSLLAAGADPHRKTDANHSALFSAVSQNHIEAAKLLSVLNCDINVVNIQGETPLLHMASWLGEIKCEALFKWLLSIDNIDVNAKNAKNNTAIIRAAKYRKTELVELLIKRGAYVNERNNKGFTALNRFCQTTHYGDVDIIHTLMRANADLELADTEYGLTPVMWAAHNGHAEAIEVLLSYGASLNTLSRHHESIFGIAVERKQLSSMATLIAAGVEYYPFISNDDKLLTSPLIVEACYELANRILSGLVSITFSSQQMPTLNGIDSATELTIDLDPTIKNHVLFLRAIGALAHVLRYSETQKIQDLYTVIIKYLTNNDNIAQAAENTLDHVTDIVSHTIDKNRDDLSENITEKSVNPNNLTENIAPTLTLSAEKIACIKEYMREMRMDRLSKNNIFSFMKNYFNIDNFTLHQAAVDHLPPVNAISPIISYDTSANRSNNASRSNSSSSSISSIESHSSLDSTYFMPTHLNNLIKCSESTTGGKKSVIVYRQFFTSSGTRVTEINIKNDDSPSAAAAYQLPRR